jgi:hypothetical protein
MFIHTTPNSDVTTFLDELHHPLRKEIELLRICILSAESNLTESVKWNGPNYSIDGEDRITMRIQPPTSKQIQIIFHRGAKKQTQPEYQLIEDPSKLLVWKENDRAIASFKSLEEIENAKAALKEIVKNWVETTK